jgi:hypothetical protein
MRSSRANDQVCHQVIEGPAYCLGLDWRKKMAMFHQSGKETCGGLPSLSAPNNVGPLLGFSGGEHFG